MALLIGMSITFFLPSQWMYLLTQFWGQQNEKKMGKKEACVQDKELSRSARQIALVVSTAFSDYIVWHPKVLQREKNN